MSVDKLTMAILTRMEKMLFPCFLLIFEVVFLVLFGLLVKYDELGQPVLHNSTAAGQLSAPGVSIVSTYPRKPYYRYCMVCQLLINTGAP